MGNLNVGYSFILGVFAALNPCGFAMLPAYLSVFTSSDRGGDARSRLRRALTVSAVVTAGFVAVFALIGLLIRVSTGFGVLTGQARWAGLVIGVAMVAAGFAMLAGWQPPLSTARLAPQVPRGRDARTMLLFGVAYAVASIGCTIGLFLSAVFGSLARDGIAAGIIAIGAYGAGMGFVVTALTVTVTAASAGLVGPLRAVSRHLTTISAITLVLTGGYLAWYWYGAIFRPLQSDPITTTVGAARDTVLIRLTHYDAATLAVALGLVITAAAIIAGGRRRRSHNPAPDSPHDSTPDPPSRTHGRRDVNTTERAADPLAVPHTDAAASRST